MKTLFLIAGFFLPFQSFAAAPPMNVDCAVQMSRADGSLYGEDARLVLEAKPGGLLQASQILHFPLQTNGDSDVEIRLSLENNRSAWLEGSPRLTVMTRLVERSTKKLLAIGEATSDQLWTSAMLQWRKEGEGPRVIMQTLNPDLQDALEKITDSRVLEIRQTDNDQAILEAVRRGLLPAAAILRMDAVCTMK